MTDSLKPCPFCGGEAITIPRMTLNNGPLAACDNEACPIGGIHMPIAVWSARAEPRVKLTWEGPFDNDPAAWSFSTMYRRAWFADLPFVRPRIWERNDGKGFRVVSFRDCLAPTLEEAKAAAQADYERRIMEALRDKS